MQDNANNTVVGVFEDYRTAEAVVQELTSAGIPRESININSNFMTGAAGRSSAEQPAHEGGVSGFFQRLFGGEDDEEHYGHYAESVRRGNAVVTVTIPQSQVGAAVHVMNENGAINIDERVRQYRQAGYERHDPNAAPYTFDEA